MLALTLAAGSPVPGVCQDAGPSGGERPISSGPLHAAQEPERDAAPFEASDLLYAGAFGAGFAAIWPLQELEESLRPDAPPEGAADVFFSAGATLGSLVFLGGLSAAAFGVGTAVEDETLARIGLRSLEALLVAEVVVQPVKLMVGRRRPLEDEASSTEFDPFRFDTGWHSFPSGHAAQAFAVASVLSVELGAESPWVPFTAYPAAGLIAASRVVGQKHWLTDVVAGSVAGLFAGHFVERWNRDRESRGAPAFRPVLLAGDGSVYAGLNLRLP